MAPTIFWPFAARTPELQKGIVSNAISQRDEDYIRAQKLRSNLDAWVVPCRSVLHYTALVIWYCSWRCTYSVQCACTLKQHLQPVHGCQSIGYKASVAYPSLALNHLSLLRLLSLDRCRIDGMACRNTASVPGSSFAIMLDSLSAGKARSKPTGLHGSNSAAQCAARLPGKLMTASLAGCQAASKVVLPAQ